MKELRRSLVEPMISSLLPCHAFSPPAMKTMFSPMPITEFMSCVLMMVVMLNSCVMLWMSSSMTSDVLGSSPELGSSQKRYLGLRLMARAMAARFCMPPLISPGYFMPASARLTRSRQYMARSLRSFSFMAENMSSGNRTFSSTVMLSKRAEPWKSMPTSRCRSFHSLRFMEIMSRPSKRICPLVGRKRPMMQLISTVFPAPLCPMMRLQMPSRKSAVMPLSTFFSPKSLCRSFTCIILS